MFTILVVEDDLALQRMMCAYLGLNGYHTLPAARRKARAGKHHNRDAALPFIMI